MVQNRKQTTNEPREKQMRSEYIAKYLMGQRWMTEFKLGKPLAYATSGEISNTEKRALGVRRALVDLIVFYPENLEIYEFQILPRWNKFGQLLAYLEMVRQTDELRAWWDKDIVGIMVNALPDAFMAALCRKYGLLYRTYEPDWIYRYMETLRPRDYTPIQLEPLRGTP